MTEAETIEAVKSAVIAVNDKLPFAKIELSPHGTALVVSYMTKSGKVYCGDCAVDLASYTRMGAEELQRVVLGLLELASNVAKSRIGKISKKKGQEPIVPWTAPA